MTRLAGALALALVLGAAPAPARAGGPPRQLVLLGIGVPVPLELYGYDPSLEGSGAGVDLLLHGRFVFGAAFLGSRYLFVGPRIAVSGMRASDGSVSVSGYLAALGLELLLRLPLGRGPSPRWGAGLGLGPTFVLAGFDVDGDMREETEAFGLEAHAWIDVGIASWLRAALDVGLEHAFDPLAEPTFFNEPLGSNTILCFTVGPMALF